MPKAASAVVALAAVALGLAMPALAGDAKPGAGRFTLRPEEQGFTRLDTVTGALTHCDKREGTWRCTVMAEDRSALEKRLDTLSTRLDALTERVGALAARLDAVEAKASPPAPPPPEAAPPPEQSTGFPEQLLRRFFQMVRQLKHGAPAGT